MPPFRPVARLAEKDSDHVSNSTKHEADDRNCCDDGRKNGRRLAAMESLPWIRGEGQKTARSDGGVNFQRFELPCAEFRSSSGTPMPSASKRAWCGGTLFEATAAITAVASLVSSASRLSFTGCVTGKELPAEVCTTVQSRPVDGSGIAHAMAAAAATAGTVATSFVAAGDGPMLQPFTAQQLQLRRVQLNVACGITATTFVAGMGVFGHLVLKLARKKLAEQGKESEAEAAADDENEPVAKDLGVAVAKPRVNVHRQSFNAPSARVSLHAGAAAPATEGLDRVSLYAGASPAADGPSRVSLHGRAATPAADGPARVLLHGRAAAPAAVGPARIPLHDNLSRSALL